MQNIDFDAIHDAADVRTVAETYLEPARERGRFVCPSCGKGNVTARPKVWGCWSCSAHDAEGIGRDAIGLVALATNTRRIDAAKRLAGELGIGPMVATDSPGRPAPRRTITPKPPAPEPYELPSWSQWLAGLVEQSHARLMDRADDVSRRAWDYLTGERGLTPETIEAARLGVNLAWCESHDALPGRVDPCYLLPGIVLPWYGPVGVAGANVRQFHVELRDKYIMATGSRRRWVYPALPPCWDAWPGPVVVVEGEFDALLANQELGGLLPVVTAGGASCRPSELHEPHKLARFARLLIATDDDDAGRQCRDAWMDFSRRSVPVDLPGGKDLSEAHAAGADLRSWLFDVCRGLGIDLFALPGLVWEMPLGTIRGRLTERPNVAAESDAEAAAERAALLHEGGNGGRH